MSLVCFLDQDTVFVRTPVISPAFLSQHPGWFLRVFAPVLVTSPTLLESFAPSPALAVSPLQLRPDFLVFPVPVCPEVFAIRLVFLPPDRICVSLLVSLGDVVPQPGLASASLVQS